MFVKIAQIGIKYLGLVCKKFGLPITLKNRPIWSHCKLWQKSFATLVPGPISGESFRGLYGHNILYHYLQQFVSGKDFDWENSQEFSQSKCPEKIGADWRGLEVIPT